MASYQNLITKSMYDKQLDSGKGTLLHLCDDVVQQEVSFIRRSFVVHFLCFFLLVVRMEKVNADQKFKKSNKLVVNIYFCIQE